MAFMWRRYTPVHAESGAERGEAHDEGSETTANFVRYHISRPL